MRNIQIIGAIIAFFCFQIQPVSAQLGYMRRASEAMRQLDYQTAILCYHQVLQHDENAEAITNLAECYRKINDADNAEYWYSKVVRLPNTKSINKLYYGMMLQINGKCPEAKKWFQAFMQESPEDVRGQFYARACDMQDELLNKNKGIYVVKPLPFNSTHDDFSPTIVDSFLIFASDRERGGYFKRTSMWTGNPFSDLYVVPFKAISMDNMDFRFGQPERFSKDLNTKYNEAAVTVSTDQKTLYFTRNNILDGKTNRSEDGLVKLSIFEAHRQKNGGWSDVQSLPINSDEYHSAFPCLSPDGKSLYFSSNRPGGYGGMDLYVSKYENDQWSQPINLGTVVNTEANEVFPFISNDNRLYFASNGHMGLGGLDIFYTTQKGEADEWNLPVNLGGPINSTHDDFAITFGGDQTWGFFTSTDREQGAVGDDIYLFQRNAAPVEIYVFDTQTKLPVAGALVTNNLSGVTMTTGADGKIAFDMRFAECADFSVGKKGYEPTVKKVCVGNSYSGAIIHEDIAFQKQAVFQVQGMVFDMVDGLPAESASLMLLNECNKPIPEAIQTAADGRYKFKLDKDCCYTIRASLDGYIAAESDRICTKGYSSSQNFKINLNLEPYLTEDGLVLDHNTRVPTKSDTSIHYNKVTGLYEMSDGTPATFQLADELFVKNGVLFDNGNPNKPGKPAFERSKDGFLINLYYDFNQTSVNEASKSELERLLATLRNNPDLQIEIASHTDSRGSDDYNLQLSQLRADAIVDWLVQNGISKKRLAARGYGETQLVNNCRNDIYCTEEQHQMNRRTEFRILGKDGDGQNKQRKAPCEGCPF